MAMECSRPALSNTRVATEHLKYDQCDQGPEFFILFSVIKLNSPGVQGTGAGRASLRQDRANSTPSEELAAAGRLCPRPGPTASAGRLLEPGRNHMKK